MSNLEKLVSVITADILLPFFAPKSIMTAKRSGMPWKKRKKHRHDAQPEKNSLSKGYGDAAQSRSSGKPHH